MTQIKALLFDLDGVIVHTAQYHYIAWKEIASGLGYDLTIDDNEKLKGLSRADSLRQILHLADVQLDETTFHQYMDEKNQRYLSYISALSSSDALPGVISFIRESRRRGLKIGLGSASKNARQTIERLGLAADFDVIVDGTNVRRSKPDPEVFLKGAAALGVSPGQAIVFEDAQAGIDAARSGGFHVVAVAPDDRLTNYDVRIDSFEHQAILPLFETVL